MTFSLELDNKILEEAYGEIYDVLRDLADNGITQDKFESWQHQIIQEYLMAYNNPENFSYGVTKYLNSGFDISLMQNELNQFNLMTLDDVNRVAKKYFDPDNFKIAIIGNLEHEVTSFSEQFENIEYVNVLGESINPNSVKTKEQDKSILKKAFEEGAQSGYEARKKGKPLNTAIIESLEEDPIQEILKEALEEESLEEPLEEPTSD